MKIASILFLGCLAGITPAQIHASQADTRDPTSRHQILLRHDDGTRVTLSSSAIEVDGSPCIPLTDLSMALHGSADLTPSLVLKGSTLRVLKAGPPGGEGFLIIERPGLMSNQVRVVTSSDGKRQACLPATELARSMGGTLKNVQLEGWPGSTHDISSFDSQINSMMNNNLAFLSLQTKVQQVSQVTQLMSNIAKADNDAKLNAIRNMRGAVFDETESVLALAPEAQVSWARSYASDSGPLASAAEIETAIRAAFPNDPPGMRAQTHAILLLIMMGDVVGALRSYTMLMDQDLRAFSRQVMEKLGQVRRARARVIRNFATKKPPRAYAGDNPKSAARAQDKAQRYTQFVQLSTQLMGELQANERELIDILQTMQRDLDNVWQAYASMRDQDFRTKERIMRIQ